MARPEKFKEPISTTFTLEKEEYEAINKIRWREHEGLGDLVRKACIDYIRIHKAGNTTYTIDSYQDPNFRAVPATLSSKEKWSKFIRENTNKQERTELDNMLKFIRSEIDAVNWLEGRK